uniref:Uncharacterized protein n=1 Tax=Avena sativa TaxID=4498 RepID=A0ACD6AWH3_AVESA
MRPVLLFIVTTSPCQDWVICAPAAFLGCGSGPDGALTLPGAPFQGTWARSVAEDASPDYNSNDRAARFSSWAVPGSLAVTRGILVSFFSSAYLYS